MTEISYTAMKTELQKLGVYLADIQYKNTLTVK